ncbi:DUF2807 domain-containing protein [Undibacterium sp. CY7W]|uniref:DUF2807 domain-containing protein n=1 Tax=Undibacterium rugosum TaxID=2762291 RepID=A0A923HZY1_9BURK|nr:DUF2807 domain-containing protein [Undibacterium rugosum]MBC3933927.1 DUF2807 domain-containing protein [Undibacterium rugosum]
MQSIAKPLRKLGEADYTEASLIVSQYPIYIYSLPIMLKTLTLSSLFVLALSACEVKVNGVDIKANGKTTTQRVEVADFDSVQNESFFDVVITQGQKSPVEITGDEKLVPEIIAVVENKRLVIRTKSKSYRMSWTNRPGTVSVSTPVLLSLLQSGSGDIEVRALNNEQFTLEHHGSGDVKVSGKTGNLKVMSAGSGELQLDMLRAGATELDLNGSGSVSLATVAGELNARHTSSGDLHVSDLQSVAVKLSHSGSGNVELRGPVNGLQLEHSGSGDVEISGVSSKIADLQLHGSGELRLRGETDELKMTLKGSGDVDIDQLKTSSLYLINQGPANIRVGGVQQQLQAELSGSGDLEADFSSNAQIDLTMRGSGKVNMQGKAKSLRAQISGSGDLDAEGLLLETARVQVTGPSQAVVNVKKAGGSRQVKIDRTGVLD